MAWCLIKSDADKFRKALKDGTIDPVKLAGMTSLQRRAFFTKFANEEVATKINALFESKLLLKNQQQGMITWAKRTAGITPQTKRDIISRIERMDKFLDPKEGEQFLEDLASQKLGVGVSQEEAKNISDLSKKIQDLKGKLRDDSTFEKESDRLDYGRAKVALYNYVNNLKLQSGKKTLTEVVKDPVKLLSSISGNAKAIRASMDNSAIFRQGWKTLLTNPRIWLNNAKKSFGDIWRTFGKDQVINELNADLISRPNAINENYKRMKLALGTVEEEFPESFASKIPIVGKSYQASENAFTAFVYKTRADVADKYIEIAEKSGVELDDRELRSIGKLTNSLTGRGSVGALEPASNVINNVFWSPRKLKADIDTLTLHALDKDFSSFARKQSAKNLLKIVASIAAILGIANAIRDDSVDFDPRSADFGKIKIGNSRFDVTAGMSSIVVLASRLLSGASKSSTTGKVTTLNADEYGSMTKKDVLYNFFENKLSPATAVVKELLEGKDFSGNDLTAKTILTDLFVPLPIANISELKKDPDSANILVATIADMLGISVNTYSVQSNWENSTSKTLQQFKEYVGDKKFKEANEKFNRRYNDWIKRTINSDKYKSLSEDSKKNLITAGKEEIQASILKEYRFEYRSTKTKVTDDKKTIKELMPE